MTVVLLTASAIHEDLGVPTLIVGVLVTLIASAVARRNPLPVARAVSASTISLVAGLFVLVHAIEDIGALDVTSSWLARASRLPPWAGGFIAGSVVAVANNAVNNLPLGLIVGAGLRRADPSTVVANAVLIGVDLGPNLSVTGSLATILWLIALRQEKISVSFLEFLKVGVVVMPLATIAAIGGLLATHTLFR